MVSPKLRISIRTYFKLVSILFAFHIMAEVAIPDCNGVISRWFDFFTPCGLMILAHAGLEFPSNVWFREGWEITGILSIIQVLIQNALFFSLLTGFVLILYRKHRPSLKKVGKVSELEVKLRRLPCGKYC